MIEYEALSRDQRKAAALLASVEQATVVRCQGRLCEHAWRRGDRVEICQPVVRELVNRGLADWWARDRVSKPQAI